MKKDTISRYRSIDGIRGIAALGVVFYHLSGNLKPELSQLLPEFINIFFSYGYLGVPIFFVISGFVISLSVGNTPVTPRYAGQFIIRRSIRLDPTYWVAIALSLVLILIKNSVLNESVPLPGFTNILAHMFYLQDLLEIKPVISVVYWTLCLEVQLYLFYLFTVWLSQKVSQLLNFSVDVIHILIITLVGVYSVSLDLKLSSLEIQGLFLSYWHYFLLGVLVSNVVRKLPYSMFVLGVWLVFELTMPMLLFFKPYIIVGICSCVFIFILWKFNLLNTALTRREFQYLGKISYTLYLIHPDIGWKVISLGKVVFHNIMSPMVAGLLFIVGIAASILSAHILHILVERPSLILCNRLKNKSFREAIHEILGVLKIRASSVNSE